MYDEMTGQGLPAPRKRRFTFGRKDRAAATPRPDLLRIVSSGRLVDVYDCFDHPTTSMLAAEDAVWQFRRADWLERRPRRWQVSRHREWREEGRLIEQKRQRLVELTGAVRTIGHTT